MIISTDAEKAFEKIQHPCIIKTLEKMGTEGTYLKIVKAIYDRKESEVAQSCPTLWDPMDYSPPGSSVHGILKARVLEWVAISFSRRPSQPRDQTQVSCIASGHFTVWATREVIYDKPTANIILNGEKWKAFPLRWGTRKRCPLSPLLFNIVLEVLATAIREEKEIKVIQIIKEAAKLSLFADDMILYIENPKDSIRKLLGLIGEFSKVAGYKINTQKSLAFLYTNNENAK